MNEDREFRDRLVTRQQFSPGLRDKHERGLRQMFHRELTSAQRAWYGALAVLGLLATLGLACTAIFGAASPSFRAIIGSWALILLPISLINLRIASRGEVDVRWRSRTVGKTAWYGGLMLMGVVLIVVSRSPNTWNNTYILLIGLVPLIIGAVRSLQERINQSELSVREEILRIEVQLAEVTERLAAK
jgi:hypothetical protein